MNKIIVSTLHHPQKKIIATCVDCKKIIHAVEWSDYVDYKKKRKKFDNYTVCPYCANKGDVND
jgi:hypothetical protein